MLQGQLLRQTGKLSTRRKAIAMSLAVIVDAIQLFFFPAFFTGAVGPDLFLDIAMALALMVLCGFRWQVVVGLILELVPGLTLFPTWFTLVALIPSEGKVEVVGSGEVIAEAGVPKLPEGDEVKK
jgi:hypothetical protein